MIRLKIDEKELKNKLQEFMGKLAFSIHREIVLRIPRRFKNRITVQNYGNSWEVGTNDEIFRFWEKGTRPHIIEPRNKQALKFQWDNAPSGLPSFEGYYFFKKVNHPGTEGKEVMKKILENERLMIRLIEDIIRTLS
jgi:hypothetical protein